MSSAGKQTTTPPSSRIPQFTLGDRLRRARRDAGMEAQDIAAALGVSRNTISNAENDRGPVARRTLVGWAWATGVDIRWLEHGSVEVEEARGRDERRAVAATSTTNATKAAQGRQRTAAFRQEEGLIPYRPRNALPVKSRPRPELRVLPSAS